MIALNENVIVEIEKDAGPKQTASGLYLHSSGKSEDENVLFGKIVEVSALGKEDSLKHVYTQFQADPGAQKVWFNKYNSYKITVNDKEYYVVDIRNVLAIQ